MHSVTNAEKWKTLTKEKKQTRASYEMLLENIKHWSWGDITRQAVPEMVTDLWKYSLYASTSLLLIFYPAKRRRQSSPKHAVGWQLVQLALDQISRMVDLTITRFECTISGYLMQIISQHVTENHWTNGVSLYPTIWLEILAESVPSSNRKSSGDQFHLTTPRK